MFRARRFAGILSVLAALALGGAGRAAEEIDIAREALRDGLWDVARSHAAQSETREAKLIVLESYAREDDWAALARALDGFDAAGGTGDDEAFVYYRALALAGTGAKADAGAMLAGAAFKSSEYRALAAGLRARLAVDAGDKALALKLIRESRFESADATLRMTAADVLEAAGAHKDAERIWRELAGATNVPERVFAAAAANLGDVALLREAVSRARDAAVRRFAGLRLGRLLIEEADTFDEGARTIRAIVKDAPDTEGAKDAALSLADAYLGREAWQAAADAFRDALEIWPETAHLASVQEGRGWAFKRLGRSEEAGEAFARAEAAATDDEDRARAILEQGDILAESGRDDDAMAKYRLVLEKYPDSTAASRLKVVVRRRELEAQGRELYKDYRFAEAQRVFAELAKGDDSQVDRAEFMSILCLYGQGLDKEAQTRAKALAEKAGDSAIRAEATLWLAKFDYNQGRWSEAAQGFMAYVATSPTSPRAPAALTWAARAAFAESDFNQAIRLVTQLAETYPKSPELASGYLIQGEALMELGRFDEAILVLERVLLEDQTEPATRHQAEVLKADALFALGADNPARYQEALDAYRAVRQGESLSPGMRLAVSFKMGRTFEKLKRTDEAIDQYYTGVVLAYREGRQKGVKFDDEARAAFARAAFRLADEYESRGRDFQAMHILELVIASDVPAADEAEKRLDRIQTKGKFL